jgi:hypothetical protein
MMDFGPAFYILGVGIVAMSTCVRKCFTKGYVGFKVSIKLWAAPWPSMTWKWSYQNKGSKDRRLEYLNVWIWLRLLFGF